MKSPFVLVLFCFLITAVSGQILEQADFKVSSKMSDPEISAYWSYLDPKVATTKSVDLELDADDQSPSNQDNIARIRSERLNKDGNFTSSVTIKSKYGNQVFSRTVKDKEGYMTFDTFTFRFRGFFTLDKERNLNPLFCTTGYFVLDEDIPFYDTVGKITIGKIRQGSVVPVDSFSQIIYIPLTWDIQGSIRTSDLKGLSRLVGDLQKKVTYEIRGKKVYRKIDGVLTRIDKALETDTNGDLYIENTGNSAEFFFWESKGDYFFSKDGKYLRFGYVDGFGA